MTLLDISFAAFFTCAIFIYLYLREKSIIKEVQKEIDYYDRKYRLVSEARNKWRTVVDSLKISNEKQARRIADQQTEIVTLTNELAALKYQIRINEKN